MGHGYRCARRVAAGVLLLAGCASERPLPGAGACPGGPTPPALRDAFAPARMDEDDLAAAIAKALRAQETGAKDLRPRELLVLSGGGAWGAFGAGYLRARFDREPGFRYSVVTGISAGAILSTAAFIADLEALDEAPTLSDDELVERRFLLSLLWKDAWFEADGIRALLERTIDRNDLVAVARGHAQGRRLYVGTVDADTGAFVAHDLGAIATAAVEGGEDAYEIARRRFLDAILASAAIPVALEPVYIDCHMHIDGAARHVLFLDQVLETPRSVVRSLAAKGPGGLDSVPPIRVTGLVNGRLALPRPRADDDAPERGTVAPRAVPIGVRALEIVLDEAKDEDVRRLCDLRRSAEALDGSVEALDVRVVTADGTACREASSFPPELFQNALMRCLFDEGRAALDALPYDCADVPGP